LQSSMFNLDHHDFPTWEFWRREFDFIHYLDLENLIKHHTFVGVVDTQKGYSCIQHETQLYLVYHFSFW
jgi:hypothetical protein